MCDGFVSTALDEAQRQRLEEMARGESAAFEKQMIEHIESATHLDKYDKMRLEMELKTSSSAFISGVLRTLHLQQEKKTKSKNLAHFISNLKSAPIKVGSALEYCGEMYESLQNQRKTMESLLRTAAVFVPSLRSDVPTFEVLAMSFNQPLTLEYPLNLMRSSIEDLAKQETFKLFPGETESFKRQMQEKRYPSEDSLNDFVTIDDLLTNERIRMSQYSSEVWQVSAVNPFLLMMKSSDEILYLLL